MVHATLRIAAPARRQGGGARGVGGAGIKAVKSESVASLSGPGKQHGRNPSY